MSLLLAHIYPNHDFHAFMPICSSKVLTSRLYIINAKGYVEMSASVKASLKDFDLSGIE